MKKITKFALKTFLLIIPLSIILFFSSLFISVAAAETEKTETVTTAHSLKASDSGRLVLLHTNDHHGHLLPGTDDLGGIARLSTLIKRLRAQFQTISPNKPTPQNHNVIGRADHDPIPDKMTNPAKTTNPPAIKSRLSKRGTTAGWEFSGEKNVLLVDAGDINTGTPLSDFFDARPDFLIYNYLGYDFATFGNHEFDISLDRLTRQIELADFPFISSNVMLADGRFLGVPWVILNYDFGRIAFFGITVASEKIIIQKGHEFRIMPEIETARKMTDFLRKQKKADLIIALTHLGFTTSVSNAILSLDLVKQVPDIDVIIDGHSHTKIDSPVHVGKTVLVTANCYGRYLGALVLDLTKGKITNVNWTCYPIDQSLQEDPEIKKFLVPFQKKTKRELNKIITTTTEAFSHDGYPCRFREVALGDMICDGIVKTLAENNLPVDFAFITGGNIRAELPKSSVTLENILEILPFRNQIWRLTLKGSDLSEFFQTVASARPGFASFAQISAEVRYKLTYQKSGPGTISDLRINEKEIEPDRLYRIGTIDFLAQGGDGYDVLLKRIQTDITRVFLYESFANYLRSLPAPIRPITGSRITIIKKE